MSADFEDWSEGVVLRGYTIETLPIDIKAQTVGNLKIDIAAQSLSQLSVNIAASAITLQVNIASITAGVVFNVAQSGSWTINAVESGTWTINIGAPLDASGNLKTAVLSSVQLDVNIAASAVTLQVNIASVTAGVVFNVAQSGSWTINAAQSGTWTINIGGPLDASGNVKTAILSSVQLNVNIAASAVTLNVAIQSSAVTLQVNIASVTDGVVFNVAQSGSWTINAVESGAWTVNAAQTGTWTINIGAPLDASGNLKTAILSSVQLNVNIAASAVTLNVAIQSSAVTLNVAIQSSAVTLNVAIQSSAVTLNVDVTNPALTVGQASPTLSFDGVHDYIWVSSNNGFPTTAISAETRIKPVVDNTLNVIVQGANSPTSGDYYYRIGIQSDNRIRFTLGTGAAWSPALVGPVLSTGVQYHVVGTWNGSEMCLYVDGSLVAGPVSWSGPLGLPQGLLLGKYTATGNEYPGLIDEVRIYNRALSADEITDLYNNPHAGPTQGLVLWLPMSEGVGTSVADKSGQGNNGTIYGATWVSREGSVPATVNTNIVAQSIGNIGIDIKAQTLSQLNVNIAASAVTLNVNISSQSVTLNVSVTGTANVNITDAIVNISALKLMDTGTIQRVYGQVANGTLTLYTVPAGKKFYIFSACLNVHTTAAVAWGAGLFVYDGATQYYLLFLQGPDAVRQANEAIGFTVMSIPAGWSVRLQAISTSVVSYACVVGVETAA